MGLAGQALSLNVHCERIGGLKPSRSLPEGSNIEPRASSPGSQDQTQPLKQALLGARDLEAWSDYQALEPRKLGEAWKG